MGVEFEVDEARDLVDANRRDLITCAAPPLVARRGRCS
jgi:hypothetical protein